MKVQIPAAFEFLFSPSRYKVPYGGRGAAKSWSIATALLIEGTQKKHIILCTREFQVSIKDSVKSLLDKKIKDLKLDYFYTSTRDQIIGINGTQIIFAGLKANISNIKSLEGVTIVWIEEGQTISQASLDVLIPTIRETDSEIWISFNTGLEKDPVYKMFIKEGKPDSVVRKINYDENPFFPDVLRKEMKYDKEHDTDKYNHIWLGNPLTISDAVIFKGKFKIDRFEAPENATFYLGLDLGFSTDPLAFIRCYIDNDNRKLFIDKAKGGIGIEIDDTAAFLEGTIPDSKKWMITADSARPEIISYLHRHGFRIRKSRKGKDSVVEGIEFIKNYTTIIHESLKSVIHEFNSYSYKVDKLTGDILPLVEDKNNHFIDALRYATERLRRPMIPSKVLPPL